MSARALLDAVVADFRTRHRLPETAQKFEYDEDEHPRGPDGKWIEKGSEGEAPTARGPGAGKHAGETFRDPKKFGPGTDAYHGQHGFCETDARRLEEGVPPEILKADLGPMPIAIPAEAVGAVVKDYGDGTGLCYEMAAKFVQDNPDWVVVHTTLVPPFGPHKDKVYFHAFAEKEGMVFDGTVGKIFQRSAYYKHFRVIEADTRRFTRDQMFNRMIVTKHWGAWDAVP